MRIRGSSASKTFRVGIFLPNLAEGGVERTMLNLAKGLADRGLEIDLVLAKAEGRFLPRVPSNVRVLDLGARLVSSRLGRIRHYTQIVTCLPSLVHYLRAERPLALLSAKDHANLGAIMGKLLSKVPTRVVITQHGHISIFSDSALRGKGRFIPYLVRYFYPRADAIVAVSEGVAKDLVRTTGMSSDSIEVIYNPVITPEVLQRATEPVEHPWFAPSMPPVVLGVGRLNREKDFPTLIKAFALARQQRLCRLMILGDGEERPNLEALVRVLGIENDVSMPGFVDNPYKYMAKSTVFVLSSAWEGLPTVLIEALAMGTRVISTDCESGPKEILGSGRFGQLVPVGDAAKLAQAILNAFDQPSYPVPKEALERFTLDAVVDRYLHVLQVKDSLEVNV